MKPTQHTKRALLTSVLSAVLCASLLLGTTMAWFTDSATNTGNVIEAGELKISATAYDLDMQREGSTKYTVPGVNNGQPFTFSADGMNLKQEDCPAIISEDLWEPGQSNAKLLEVKNTGDLATDIRLSFAVEDGGLMDALWFGFVRVDGIGNLMEEFVPQDMSAINEAAQQRVVCLKPGERMRLILVYGMKEEAGNIYQGKTFAADVTIMATQAMYETDGFGSSEYDRDAGLFQLVSTEEELRQAVEQGGTIVLAKDIVVSSSMEVAGGTKVVLDMNGKNITVAENFSSRLFSNYGDLTIRGNGAIDVSNAGANGYGTVNNFGTLTVVDGTYTNLDSSDASNFYNRNGGTATFINPTIYGGGGCVATEVNTTTEIHGGYYEDSTYPAVENRGDMLITAGIFKNTSCSSCAGKWGYTIRSGESASSAYLKIQGAAEDSVQVTGVQGGLAVIGGTADVYNGVYKTEPCAVHTSGSSSFYAGYFTGESYKTATTIYGGTFQSCSKTAILVGNGNPAPDSGEGEESTVIIQNGTFIGGDANKTAITVNQAQYAIGAAKIFGGSFSSDPSEYLAQEYTVSNVDDMWIVAAQ